MNKVKETVTFPNGDFATIELTLVDGLVEDFEITGSKMFMEDFNGFNREDSIESIGKNLSEDSDIELVDFYQFYFDMSAKGFLYKPTGQAFGYYVNYNDDISSSGYIDNKFVSDSVGVHELKYPVGLRKIS